MKLLYRHKLDNKWHKINFKELKNILRSAVGTDAYEIRKPCDHKKTFINDGIKCCELCGDVLEITSYRD